MRYAVFAGIWLIEIFRTEGEAIDFARQLIRQDEVTIEDLWTLSRDPWGRRENDGNGA